MEDKGFKKSWGGLGVDSGFDSSLGVFVGVETGGNVGFEG
jgi:hypothetical protein